MQIEYEQQYPHVQKQCPMLSNVQGKFCPGSSNRKVFSGYPHGFVAVACASTMVELM